MGVMRPSSVWDGISANERGECRARHLGRTWPGGGAPAAVVTAVVSVALSLLTL